MELSEFINAKNHKENFLNELLVKEYNKELLKKYPFIQLYNDQRVFDKTFMDNLPDGWRIGFGQDLLDCIQKFIVEFNYGEQFKIVKLGINLGKLVYEDNINDNRLLDKISVFKNKAKNTCSNCGEEANQFDNVYYLPYCSRCIEEILKDEDHETISFSVIGNDEKNEWTELKDKLYGMYDKLVDEYLTAKPLIEPKTVDYLEKTIPKLKTAIDKILDIGEDKIKTDAYKFSEFGIKAIEKTEEVVKNIKIKFFNLIPKEQFATNNVKQTEENPAPVTEKCDNNHIQPTIVKTAKNETEEADDFRNINNPAIKADKNELCSCLEACSYLDELKKKVTEFYNDEETQKNIYISKKEFIRLAEKWLDNLKDNLNK